MVTLVTGATGFAGVNIVRKIAETGEQVVGIDNIAPNTEIRQFLDKAQSQVRFVTADIVDATEVLRIATDYHVERFVHAAALTPTLEFETSKTRRVFDVNLMGTVNVLEAARLVAADRFVFVSSSGVYGAPDDRRENVTEDSVLHLDKLYTICKYSCELIVKRYQDLFGLPTVIGRMCAIYGPMERISASRANPSMIYKVLAKLASGQQVRARGGGLVNDYTHAEDAATIWANLTLHQNIQHDVYNVSAGVPYSLGDTLEIIHSLDEEFAYQLVTDDEDADVEILPDGERGALDISRAKTDFGFEPKYDLRSGIKQYLEWAREFPDSAPKLT